MVKSSDLPKKLNFYRIKSRGNSSQILIPLHIFRDRNLTPLESLVKFLRQRRGLSYHKISDLINRNVRDVYKLFQSVLEKPVSKFKISLEEPIFVPVEIFSDKKFHALEAIVVYLHEKVGLKFSQIADLIGRDQRTIWTSYSRARKKNVETK